METPKTSSEGGTSDPKLQICRPQCPESSSVLLKTDHLKFDPSKFSSGGADTYTDTDMSLSVSRPESPVPSCLSMKSDHSMFDPPNFSSGKSGSDLSQHHVSRLQSSRAQSPEPSCVSMKSNHSMFDPPNFSRGTGTDLRFQAVRAESPVPSCVSMKSDHSMFDPPNFNSGKSGSDLRLQTSRAQSPEPSCVSMKSNHSMFDPPNFSSGGNGNDLRLQAVKVESPEPSCVSMKSDHSMFDPPNFSRAGTDTDLRSLDVLKAQKCAVCEQFLTDPVSITCGHRFCRQCISSYWDQSDPLGGCPKCRKKSRKHFVLHSHKATEESVLQYFYQTVDDQLQRVLKKHKTNMKTKYEILFEGIKIQENEALLNRIYTQLYIIEQEHEGVNEEHEVFHMEKRPKKQHLQDIPINCLEIFKPVQGPERENKEENIRAVLAERVRPNEVPEKSKLRTVLTKGIAGIGKTVSVQKFILDWAEGKANQDVDFMFVLPFRELNLIRDDQYNLHTLVCDFYPELRELDLKVIFDVCKVVFIFDGLDESRILLNFPQNKKISDINTSSSVSTLITNLITGELLPSALIWISTRPAAAHQIPTQYINRVTEIQGFNDAQKEEYFKKKITDQEQAKKIISHIKTARSLHIMCHIPVFCWITATVLQKIIKQDDTEIPKTLTEMYTHFLHTQTNMKREKYEHKTERDPNKLFKSSQSIILKLAELAFMQLMKGNVMFYEEDLRDCGIEVTDASVYSGICTEIFREESVLYQKKVYCFVHLSFQEFLAALYVFHCYVSKNLEALHNFLTDKHHSEDVQLDDLLMGAVHEALKSQNGHLDLFLRFLLGISVESNQRLLQGLLTQTQSSLESISKITCYIKKKIKGEDELDNVPVTTRRLMMEIMKQKKCLPSDRSINLFLCLTEMKDQTLSKEIYEYLNSGEHSELSPSQCSTLACMLQISEEVVDELDLKKYNTSEEGYRRLIPAITNCHKAQLSGCYITTDSCEILISTLQEANSSLKDLDLSNNDLEDSGLNLISIGLKSSQCKLEILRLAGCNLNINSCEILASTLQAVDSQLKVLDLSNNDIQDSGIEMLSEGLKNSHCKLEVLRLAFCKLGGKACESLGATLQQENSHLKELDLNNNDLLDVGVNLLSDGLKSLHCKLKILRLSGCLVTEEGCCSLASALVSHPSQLKELDLSYNHLGDLGMSALSAILEDQHCNLDILKMEHADNIRLKPGLQKYACEVTLDPNTANTRLFLSEGNRKVVCVRELQSYPDHPERFDGSQQILCRESLSGRCYWEAEWSGEEVSIGVTCKGIKRKGDSDDCRFGWNEKSWILNCFNDPEDSEISYSAWHNKKDIVILIPPCSSNRVGVYLDWPAGILSFYSVSSETHSLTHLYTFHSTFTEPLYAGFRVWDLSSVCV